ncbi:hypothetical protein THAOC_20467, partial [Thalassiosira oceanica]
MHLSPASLGSLRTSSLARRKSHSAGEKAARAARMLEGHGRKSPAKIVNEERSAGPKTNLNSTEFGQQTYRPDGKAPFPRPVRPAAQRWEGASTSRRPRPKLREVCPGAAEEEQRGALPSPQTVHSRSRGEGDW